NIRDISLSSNGGLFVLFHSSNAASSILSVSPDCFKCAATLIPAWSLSPSLIPVIILLIQILVLTLRASPLVVICLFKGSCYTSFKLSDTLFSVSISKLSEGCFALFFIYSISNDIALNEYSSILYSLILLLIVFASRNNRVLS